MAGVPGLSGVHVHLAVKGAPGVVIAPAITQCHNIQARCVRGRHLNLRFAVASVQVITVVL